MDHKEVTYCVQRQNKKKRNLELSLHCDHSLMMISFLSGGVTELKVHKSICGMIATSVMIHAI